MPRGRTVEIVNHGSRAEAEGVFSDRKQTISESTRLILYALVVSSPNIQETVGDRVPQGAFSHNVHGSDGAYAGEAHQFDQRPAHDVLPVQHRTPVGILEQMFEAPSAESPYDPYQAEDYAQAQPEQFAQPELEATPGTSPVPVAELEQVTGMNQYDQLQVESSAAQDYPAYNALAEQAAAAVRLPGANDEAMAARARDEIDKIHGLGYVNLDDVPGALQEL